MFKRAIITVLVGGVVGFGAYNNQAISNLDRKVGVLDVQITNLTKAMERIERILDSARPKTLGKVVSDEG